jgi:RNA polymerase sigma factor (sigma-70 family)
MEASAVPRLAPVGVGGAASPRLLRLASDDRLIALIRVGNRAAFEAAYDRHHRSILSFCRHVLGSTEEAEDAVQHTFLAAYNDLLSSDKPIHLRAWLFTIARNRCYSTLRARREHPSAELVEPVTEGLATQVQRRQDLRDLVGDLGRLPDDQRAALVLAEMDALSHEQIGAALGVPCEKVKALVFQARESLVASRNARDTDCVEIRKQLATMHGGALRRAGLRRHLRDCAGCRDYRKEIDLQRRALAVILPVAPTIALKEGVLGVAIGTAAGAGAAGGGMLAGSALKGFTVKGLIAAAAAGIGTAGTIVATQDSRLVPILPSHPARTGPGASRAAGPTSGGGPVASARSSAAVLSTSPAVIVSAGGTRRSAAATSPVLNPSVPVVAGVSPQRSGPSRPLRTAKTAHPPVPAPAPMPAVIVAAQPVPAATIPSVTALPARPFLGSSAYGTAAPTVVTGSRRGAASSSGASRGLSRGGDGGSGARRPGSSSLHGGNHGASNSSVANGGHPPRDGSGSSAGTTASGPAGASTGGGGRGDGGNSSGSSGAVGSSGSSGSGERSGSGGGTGTSGTGGALGSSRLRPLSGGAHRRLARRPISQPDTV